MLDRWNNRCAVTGATTLDAIRASHIKAWRFSDGQERLDPNNGLPLIASLDALVDAGIISFGVDGELLISKSLSQSERKLFGLEGAKLTKKPSPQTAQYLAIHASKIFRGS